MQSRSLSGKDQMATKNPAREPADLRTRLVHEFAAFGPAYMRWVHSRMPAGDMTYARMRLLGALRHKSPQIMSELSEELGVTPRNITALVDALEEEDMVRRRPHPTDRRATFVDLTAEGTHLCRGAFTEHVGAVSELFDALSPDDQEELARLLGQLQAALHSRGIATGVHPYRACPGRSDPDDYPR